MLPSLIYPFRVKFFAELSFKKATVLLPAKLKFVPYKKRGVSRSRFADLNLLSVRQRQ